MLSAELGRVAWTRYRHRAVEPAESSRRSEPAIEASALAVGDDTAAMELALAEAAAAIDHDDVPIGAVVLHEGRVVASRHNERERRSDPTAHAELLALRDAATRLTRWRLDDCTLVVTLEPCPMCAGAVWAARIGRVVFGAADPRAGAVGSLYNIAADPRLNHESLVTRGVLADRCAALIQGFFAERR